MANELVPPGVYTQTFYGAPPVPAVAPNLIPVYIGTGAELLQRQNLPMVRGSSSTVDQRVTDEDEAGRWVVAVNPDGSISLGSADGSRTRFQVRNFPLVNGDGTGTAAADTSTVNVTVDGVPVVVLALTAATGVVEISEAPAADAVVRCTYYFDRTDTLGTDTLSAQVTPEAAVLNGQVGQNFAFTRGVNDVFAVEVDGAPAVNVTLPSSAPTVTAAVVVAAINGTPGIGTLVASAYLDAYGRTCIRLTAAQQLKVGTGTANTALGFVPGAATSRNRTFYTFNGPIVTGNRGGVTTTSPADVVVKVNGVQVIPTAVDGANRAVTLPLAPPVGATVTVRYYWNTWQDTFDYLENIGITSIDRVGLTPEGSLASTYVNGVSYVLKDDRIMWGTASLVSAGSTTAGGAEFGSAQVQALLVDQQVYLDPCAATLDTTGAVAVASTTVFQLGHVPTVGNGRGNPLGAELYGQVANGRGDLPTTRPDLVTAYWGFGVQDAMRRGPVAVVKVDPTLSQITLASAVPVGATVYASYYYNTLVDQAFVGSNRGYTLTCVAAGAGGVGTYTVTNGSGSLLRGVRLLGKGAALASVTVQFPSGSEFYPDARIEGGTPVDETVTVTFATSDTTPARYVTAGPQPWYFVAGASDRLRVTLDASDQQTGLAAGIDLAHPTGASRSGAFASLMGNEVQYDLASGETTYDVVAGQNDALNFLVDGVSLAATATAGVGVKLQAYMDALNAAAVAPGNEPYYTGASAFANGYVVTGGACDLLSMHYTGLVTGPSGVQVIALTPGTYATVTDLVAQINAQLAGINGAGGLIGSLACTATADAKLRFTLTLNVADSSGYFEFINGAAPARDFAVVAGLDTGATGGLGTKLYNGPIARRYTVTTTAGRRPYDRLVLRNRIFPGDNSVAAEAVLGQCGITCQGGNGAVQAGVAAGMTAPATVGAVTRAASLLGVVGWDGGVNLNGHPDVTFYDGSDLVSGAANNVFTFSVNGTTVTTTFTASGAGTVTALGPIATAGTVLFQLDAAITAAGVSALVAVRQEGAGVRIYLRTAGQSPTSNIAIGAGTATTLLGFTAGDSAMDVPVTAADLASTLMNHAVPAGSFATFVLQYLADPGYFAGRALAGTEADASGNEFLYLQSLTLGTSSSIAFKTPTAASAFNTGTQFGVKAGDGASGRAAVSGYYVTSSNPVSGSGSANTSVLNAGTGQDGYVGQTYVDSVTGLTFTVLPRAGGLAYPTGATSTLSFGVGTVLATDGNIPTLAVPGLELTVTNTQGVVVGDTALVETFKKDGPEPAIGEVYYCSYTYAKQDFSPKLFARLPDVVAEYGPVTPDNPLSLAAYFAFLNGGTVIACKQVPRRTGSATASEASYMLAIDALAGASLPGNQSPSVLVPLTGATQNLAAYVAKHCDVQSSIRYRAERTANFGFSAGTLPQAAGNIAAATGSMRVRFVYPDIATTTLTDVFGKQRNYLIDGTYLAAAVAARTTSTQSDAATPWEGYQLVGFTALNRRLSAVVADATAAQGITILQEKLPYLGVRAGLTSDLSNVLTKIPTVTQIADEIQRRVRSTLEGFVGVKFLPQVLGQIEGQLAEMFKRAVQEQIIGSYKGLKASLDPTDPTSILVDAYYSPVFPVIYIRMTLRVSTS